MAEPSIAGMRPEGEKLSPDGKHVIYLWNAEGKVPADLYIVPTTGGQPRKLLSPKDLPAPTRPPEKENKLDYGLVLRDDFVRSRENQFGNFEWSPDSKKLVFSYSGDIYTLTIGEAAPRRYTKTQAPETGARFIDNNRILYQQAGHLFVLDTENTLITQISKEANPQNFISVFNATPNKTGTLVAYIVSDSSKQKPLVVPNYLDEFTAAPSVRRGWSEQKILVVTADGSRDTPAEIKLPKPEGVSSLRRIVWASDNRSLIVDRNDRDTKRRQIYYIRNVGEKNEQTILVTEETDDKWIGQPAIIVEPNPQTPSQLIFSSERDGFNHLYLTDVESTGKASTSQLTKGNWQVEWAKWMNGEKLVYMSTEDGYRTRTFRHFDITNRQTSKFFADNGSERMITGPQIAESSDPWMIFEASRWNEPGELFAVRAHCSGDCPQVRAPQRLTNTTPDSFTAQKWTEPRFIEIAARDGKKIPAKIYLPNGHNPPSKTKYPMVVFVHGAGYLQNVINGWNNYYREFMFNDMLAKQGFIVLDIDYRGSAGLGRDWRTDVHDFLGGKDMDDHVDAIDFMVANYAVNPTKVGVYGGSYGGFMAGMLAMRAPDKVAAAAALRPVFDWKNYYASSPGYTAQRLGFPDKNPEAYKRSSPITYADKLERPLLILHGMADDNVHVQDSVQLIEKLIRLGKTQYFEAMLYPVENHGFVRPSSWTDEYQRILSFFEKHLK